MTTKQELNAYRLSIASRVVTTRGALGWTQEEAAQSITMPLSTYRSKEDARSDFKPGEVAMLERAFGLPEGSLFAREAFIRVPVRRISDRANLGGAA